MTRILPLPEEIDRLTLARLVQRNADDYPTLPALSWRPADHDTATPWTTLTWSDVHAQVTTIATAFHALGVQTGDRVLLITGNTPEHWLSDLALTRLGAVPVSVHPATAPDHLAYLAHHTRAQLAVVTDSDTGQRLAALLARHPHLDTAALAEYAPSTPHMSFHLLHTSSRAKPAARSVGRVRPGDLATILYTSGTTGTPKAVPVTHRHVIRAALALDQVTDVPDHAEHICYLPLAHIAERMLGIYLPVLRAAHVHLIRDPSHVTVALRDLHPRQFFAVPRTWEKLARAQQAAIDRLTPQTQANLQAAQAVARRYLHHREHDGLTASLETDYAAARRQTLQPVLALTGLDRLTWATSASAPLPQHVTEFWEGFGIPLMDAWGMTETMGVATTHHPGNRRTGSVGRPLPGVEIRTTTADQEIQVRGPTVLPGYLNADGTLAPATDPDGWFSTGDLGRIDDDGYLWITGRAKDLIITSTGHNISPSRIEAALTRHPWISHAFAYGDGRPYITALLVLDTTALPQPPDTPSDARGAASPASKADLQQQIEQAVAEANQTLNPPEQVRRYALLTDTWTPSTGELTISLKPRRRTIEAKYHHELDQLYAKGREAPGAGPVAQQR